MAQDGDWSLYAYNPSKAAPIAFAIVLSIIGCYQIYQSFVKYHWKKFGGLLLDICMDVLLLTIP